MADKQIGIKLDVKSTGLSQVDDALNSVSKNLTSMNEKVMTTQAKGWGSEAQTKELREQLRYMQQVLQTAERMARTKGVHSDSFANYSREIGSMQRDLANTPSYRSSMGGRIHEKYGPAAASGFDKTMGWGGKIGAGLIAFDLISTIRSGLSTGTQLSYGYGDLAKRMDPRANSQKYGIKMSNDQQGYGYSDTDLMQSATTYGAATGRMETGKFTKQLQAIKQTGRNYGLDLSGVTENFASMYQSGVTGGSQAQMSPQEYANLVANAVNRGNMQGKETQVMNQIQQLVQMGVSSSGQSGDLKTMAGMLAMGNSSGNQSFIGNLPQYMSAINSGMSSPGGGYAGQALMMQALGGKDMGYFQTQVQAAKGAFGMNEKNGKTNIENVMTYLSKTFGGKDKDQEAVMFSTLFPGMNASQSKDFIQNFTNPDGSFKQGGLDEAKKALGNQAPTIPQNETDKYRNRITGKEHAANQVGQDTLGTRSFIDQVQGGLIDGVGAPLVYGAEGLMGYNVLKGGYKIGKSVFRKAVGGTTSEVLSEVGNKSNVIKFPGSEVAKDAGKGLTKSPLLKILGPLGEILGLSGAASAGTDFGDFIFGHSKGKTKTNSGMFATPFNATDGLYDDDKKPIWSRIFSKNKSGDSPASTSSATTSSSTLENVTGSQLAPLVASTIVALGPFMSQLKPYLGGDSSKSGKPIDDLVYRGNGYSSNNLLYQNNSGQGGLRLAGYSQGQNVAQGGGSVGAPNSALSSISYWSKKYGVPDYIGQSIAMAESSLNPNDTFAEANGTTSTGLFQLNSEGQGKGYTQGQLKDPMFNSEIGMKPISEAYKKARSLGIEDGPAMAQWVAEHSGHPGGSPTVGYHSSLDDQIYKNAQGLLNGTIKLKGEVTVNVKQADGTTTKTKVPMNAEFTGISA